MKILQVSTADLAGGAESVARKLFERYRYLGHDSWLAVGLKRTDDTNVYIIPNHKTGNAWYRLCMNVVAEISPHVGKVRGAGKVRSLLEGLSYPFRWLRCEMIGHENFDFPGVWRVFDLVPAHPDIIHCHNLHGSFVPEGGYFDLRALPWLSQKVPLVLTLHDCWLLSGHCAHSFDCERWKIGCGHCPDLTIYPSIKRDVTAYNWQRKQKIYAKSRLYVAAPSRWLIQKVEQSMLAPAVVEARVIPNGVDLSIFHSADKKATRATLNIKQNANVLLFTSNTVRRNTWKDYQTMRDAVARVAHRINSNKVLFIALGEDAPVERIGRAEVHFVPYLKDPRAVALYYQAADIYIHAARADTFPNTILEALACGKPVVATAVGGIPEQVKNLDLIAAGIGFSTYGCEEATGVLVPPGDAEAMAQATITLLTDKALLRRLGDNGAREARACFDLEYQVQRYLEWYRAIIEKHKAESSTFLSNIG